jgi:hypothetical protein
VASLTLVKLLFCGQGMTTLVEVYDDGVEKPAADFLALIDCGGDIRWAKGALDYIAMKVAARPTNPKWIDLVSLSHQDGDHVALLGRLGERLKQISTPVRVGQAFVGGTSWLKSHEGTVKAFLKDLDYDTTGLNFNAPMRSDYTGATKRADLRCVAQHKDVYFRILISNLATGGTTPEERNASSAAVVVENGHEAIVLPGDGTFETMDRIRNIPNLPSLLPAVLGLEIPHHGALATAVQDYEGSENDPNKFNWTIIDGFAKAMNAKYVGASAGPWNTHCHPIDLVVDTFADKSNERLLGHSYVTYMFHTQHWRTWSNYLPIECTVRTIEPFMWEWSRKKDKTKRQKPDDEANATFTFGDIVYKLAAPGVLKPEEKVEFRPRRTIGMDGTDEVIVQAPEP